MTQCERESTLVPRFSIVIPAYNDWIPLKQCLQSLAQQTNAPEFEVIVVDDGSTEAAPEYLRSAPPDHPFTIIQCEGESTLVPRFCIVIPAYNDCIHLKPCLQSLAQQTNAPEFEVIVVDDGSTEAAPEYLRSAPPDHPFTIIQQTHAGIPAARNRGIRAAKGEV